MHRIHRVSLILLMLCSVCAVFVVQAVPAFADGNDGGYTCTGEYDCGNGGTNSTQSTNSTPCGDSGIFQARDAGCDAAKQAGMTLGTGDRNAGKEYSCPVGSSFSFIEGYKAGFYGYVLGAPGVGR